MRPKFFFNDWQALCRFLCVIFFPIMALSCPRRLDAVYYKLDGSKRDYRFTFKALGLFGILSAAMFLSAVGLSYYHGDTWQDMFQLAAGPALVYLVLWCWHEHLIGKIEGWQHIHKYDMRGLFMK